MAVWPWVALGWLACGGDGQGDPHSATPVDTDSPTVPTGEGFCAVRNVFDASCVRCHDAAGRQGGLDLETDPHAALVSVTSAAYGVTLVAPGDPDGSLLVRKMEGVEAVTEGGVMPPDGLLPEAAAVVRAWVAAGASDACTSTEPTTPTTATREHPPGWDASGAHGMATKFASAGDCRTCHGADLSGGTSGVSCDGCHAAGWRDDCTYCHGGTSSVSGAPPEDLDDNTNPATITFPPHAVHESGRIAPVYACGTCHPDTTDLLAPGHVFDDPTPGEAEVELSNGTWSARTCTDTYCHSTGAALASEVAASAPPRTCGSCHAGGVPTEVPYTSMSGEHVRHLVATVACGECHPDVSGSDTITDPARHVQGRVDLEFPPLLVRDAGDGSCAGTCHDHLHLAARW